MISNGPYLYCCFASYLSECFVLKTAHKINSSTPATSGTILRQIIMIQLLILTKIKKICKPNKL